MFFAEHQLTNQRMHHRLMLLCLQVCSTLVVVCQLYRIDEGQQGPSGWMAENLTFLILYQ